MFVLSPETPEEIMAGIRADTINKPNMGEKAWSKIQRICDEATPRMIDRHWDNMNKSERARATLVKAGKYYGQKVSA